MAGARALGLGARVRWGVVLGGAVAVVLVRGAAGCSSTDSIAGDGFGTGGHAGHSSGATPSGAGAGSSESSSGVSSFVTGTGATSTTSTASGNDPDAACAATSAKAQLIPVSMYLMFDDSGSMKDNNKWTDASTALKAFFADPGTAGLRVGLRFFPDGDCSDSACSVPACATPEVAFGALTADPAQLDNQETFLDDSVDAHGPMDSGGTPLSAALQGAESWATTYQAAHPAEKAVVVLVTDGAPNGCDETPADIVATASDAYASSGVLTYAVGLQGSNEGLMNQIAAAGMTSTAFFIGTGSNASSDLVAALKAIRTASIACQFALPHDDGMGNLVDPAKVNVDYTPGSGGATQEFGKVSNEAACGASTTGCYYDDPTNPTLINLCPDACTAVQADATADIEVLAGCATHDDTPH